MVILRRGPTGRGGPEGNSKEKAADRAEYTLSFAPFNGHRTSTMLSTRSRVTEALLESFRALVW